MPFATPPVTAEPPCRLHFNGWTLDPASRLLLDRDGQPVPLSASAFALLKAFVNHPGETLSREQLAAVLRRHHTPENRLIDVHVSQIRRVLGGNGCIRTQRNAGYVFICPVERS